MGRYINWADVVGRYRALGKDTDATEVGSSFVPYAEAEVDGRLASKFTVPFSNNNLTAKDLAIDLVYLKAGNINIKDSKVLQSLVDAKFKRLLSGDETMTYDSGESIPHTVSGTIWSNQKDYHPTFGIGDNLDFVVDSNRIIDEENERT